MWQEPGWSTNKLGSPSPVFFYNESQYIGLASLELAIQTSLAFLIQVLVLSGSTVIDFKNQDYFDLGVDHRVRSGGLEVCTLGGIVIP